MKRIAAFCLLLAGAPLAQAAERPAPYMLMRALQDMQNKIALGDTSALAGQGEFVSGVGAEFERVDPQVWSDPRNIRALASYLFSGGTPAPVRHLLNTGVVPPENMAMVRGALAYGEGRQNEAREFLLPLDPLAVQPAFGAHLALIQGALLARDASPRALAALDIARLLAPGGLIEETALRRSTFIAAQAGDLEAFCAYAGRYLRRFANSAYARDFRERLPIAIATFTPHLIEATFARIIPVIESLTPEQKLDTYLIVARAAALTGKPNVANSAARLASALAQPNSLERRRAELYRAAAAFRGPEFDKAVAALPSVSDKDLSPQDRELLAAARLVAAALRPDFTASIPLKPDQTPAPTETMQVAARALADSERLLQGTPR